MYVREKQTRTTPVLQLVKGYRDLNGKVKQKIVVSLGNVPMPDYIRKTVADEVENRMNGYQRLLPLDPETAEWVDFVLDKLKNEGKLSNLKYNELHPEQAEKIDGVLLDKIEHENSTILGPLLPIKAAWDNLELDKFLSERGFSERQLNSAKISVFNRLLDPCSENELLGFSAATALNELLGERIELSGEDRFYRISDKLLHNKDEIEIHLREREENIFQLRRTILLYDLTNSYFEGQAQNNPKARRSMNSKEKRSDCPLLSLGLVLDNEGFALGHQVFEGNIHDSRTLAKAVEQLQENCGNKDRAMVVLDGGIASQANLDYLREKGFDYLVNGKRGTRKHFAADFADAGLFKTVSGRDDKKPVMVRRIEQSDELSLLCRSDARKQKEDAIVSKIEEKLLAELEKLASRIGKNDKKLRMAQGDQTVNRTIGRIKAKYTRASKFYTVDFDLASRTLSWKRNDEDYESAAELHGCYHLRSSRKDLSDDEIWYIYIMLTKVESAFRLLKSDLGLRPFYHQKETRCDGHVFITVPAYHLLHHIEYSLRDVGLDLTWKKLRRLLSTHCYTTIIVPTADGKVRNIRRPGAPDELQRSIYGKLNINLADLPVVSSTFEKMMS